MIELTPTTIYVISTIDEVKRVLGSLCVLGFFIVFGLLFARIGTAIIESEETNEKFCRWFNPMMPKILGAFICVVLLNTFLPNQKTIAAMIVVPAIVNNENIQNISKNTLQWAEEYIKDQLQTKKKND
jgi:hypothetical protein